MRDGYSVRPRIRSLKPELFQSRHIAKLEWDEVLFFIGLVSRADDEGRGVADLRYLKSQLAPYWDKITPETIARWLHKLHRIRLIYVYKRSTDVFYVIPKFTKHQKINRPSPSALPAPPKKELSLIEHLVSPYDKNGLSTPHGTISEESLNPHGTVTERSLRVHVSRATRSGSGSGTESSTPSSCPPAHGKAVEEELAKCGIRAPKSFDRSRLTVERIGGEAKYLTWQITAKHAHITNPAGVLWARLRECQATPSYERDLDYLKYRDEERRRDKAKQVPVGAIVTVDGKSGVVREKQLVEFPDGIAPLHTLIDQATIGPPSAEVRP